MAQSKDIGKRGEDEAAGFLQGKGYEILERNYRFRRNEVDIIAMRDNTLVFVEVKMRSTNLFGYPESFVSDEQFQRILQVADEYQHQNNWEGNIRFDIVSIEKKRSGLEITHFEDAFH